jgi:urea transport system ATP-binding protein
LKPENLTLHYGGSADPEGDRCRRCRRGDLRDGHQRRRQDQPDEGDLGRASPLGRHDHSLDGEDRPASGHQLARKGVGYVPQGRDIFPLLTVTENLETGFACLPRRA